MSLSRQQTRRPLAQRLYQSFLGFAIYPSLWTAAGVASLTYFVQEALGLPPDWRAVATIFAAALLPYNLDRLLDSYVQPIPDPNVQSYFRNPGISLLLVAASLAIVALLLEAPSRVLLVSCAGIVPLIYGLPLLPLGSGKNKRWYRLKDIPGAKSWIVTGIITYAVLAVPLAYANVSPDRSAILTALFLLVLIGTNSHLFDVRDVNSDREKGVLTLPLIVGVRGNRLIWSCLNLSLLALLSGFWANGVAAPIPEVVVPVILVNLIFIWCLNPNTPRNAYSIGLEGGLFLPAILLEIAKLRA